MTNTPPGQNPVTTTIPNGGDEREFRPFEMPTKVGNQPETSCCCDHLLYMPAAVTSWGTSYHVPPLPRGAGARSDSDYVRVIAAQDGTSVTLDDGAPSSVLLDANQTATFETGRPAVVAADKPIGVYQYVKSARERGQLMGDPSIIPILPDHGLHTRARFLADSRFLLGDFATIVLGPLDPCLLTVDGLPFSGPWTSPCSRQPGI